MNLSKWATVFGLAVTVIGALLAASDLRPSSWALRPEVMDTRDQMYLALDQARRHGYQTPPYTTEQVEAAMADANLRRADDLERLKRERQAAHYEDTYARYAGARNGLCLIAFGTLLQILGATTA